MTHKKRFISTIERKPVDYPAAWLGMPHPDSVQKFLDYFQAETIEEIRYKLGDDCYTVSMPYHSPVSDAIETALDFSKVSTEGRNLNKPGFFPPASTPFIRYRLSPEICSRKI
jgi:uroporphyrinogen decarboxylase